MWDVEMLRALNRMGHDITLYTGKPLSRDLSKPIGFPTVKIKSPFLYDVGYTAPIGIGGTITDIDRQLFITQLRRHIADDHDVVHVNGYPEILRIKKSVDCPMTIKLNCPPHSLFYDYIHPTKSSYSWLYRADEVITGGVTTEDIRSKTGINPTIINPGMDADRFSLDGSVTGESELSVLFVGRFVPAKNISELLDGFAQLRNRGVDAELVLVGEGPLRDKVGEKADSLNLTDSIRFEGYVLNEELPPYYRAADIFALSSHHESFGMVLLEAMACGTPVIAPRIDYIPEIVADGEAGLLYESGDSGDPCNKMKRLLEDSERRHEMGQYAREMVTSTFRWEQQDKKLLNCFRRVKRVIQ